MKIRNGFVSNSSSSSFIILGNFCNYGNYQSSEYDPSIMELWVGDYVLVLYNIGRSGDVGHVLLELNCEKSLNFAKELLDEKYTHNGFNIYRAYKVIPGNIITKQDLKHPSQIIEISVDYAGYMKTWNEFVDNYQHRFEGIEK